MLKKHLRPLICSYILFGLLGGAGKLHAQNLELKNVTRQGFEGLKPLSKEGYYVQFIEGTSNTGKKTKQLMHVYVLGNALNVTSDFVLELDQSESMEEVVFNGGNFMVVHSNMLAKTRTMKIVDKQGKEVATKKLEKLPYSIVAKPSAVLPVGTADFLVINYLKDKKVGYSIERYNSKLEPQYSQVQIPDKKKLFPVDYTLSGDKLFVLEYVDSDLSDYFEYHLAAFDINSGAMQKKQELKSSDGKAFGFATFVKPTPNGGAVTGGMYFNGPRVQKVNSDGFFAAQMTADGNITFNYTDWNKVKDFTKDKSTAAFWGGKTKTFMHDLAINPDGSYTLIGENYRRGDADLAGEQSKSALGLATKMMKVTDPGVNDSEEALTVGEFILIDYNAQNQLTNIRKIDKPNAVTVIKSSTEPNQAPYVGQMKGLNLANILNNYGYFPYRFTVQGATQPYLAFWQRYDPLRKELLYFTPLNAKGTDTVSVNVTSADLQQFGELENMVTSKLGAIGKFGKKMATVTGDDHKNYFELRRSHDPYDYRAKDLNSRIIMSNVPGKLLIYDFVPEPTEKKKGFFAQLVDTTPGKLKVQYIDIPSK